MGIPFGAPYAHRPGCTSNPRPQTPVPPGCVKVVIQKIIGPDSSRDLYLNVLERAWEQPELSDGQEESYVGELDWRCDRDGIGYSRNEACIIGLVPAHLVKEYLYALCTNCGVSGNDKLIVEALDLINDNQGDDHPEGAWDCRTIVVRQDHPVVLYLRAVCDPVHSTPM